MSHEEVDHYPNPVEKKSLLQKYNIPIEHLSYEYITQCQNVKELERIVLILRSGEEGCYPDLTKHAEERLGVVKPESDILRISEPVLKREMLAPEKRMKLENEINKWMSEMKLREKDLDEGRAMQMNDPLPQPTVRRITFDQPQESSNSQKKRERIRACDYTGWDKYDADTELNRIDLQHKQEQAEAKKTQRRLLDKEKEIKNTPRENVISKLSLTGTELTIMAEREREKGNEAYKAGDYEEALQFYNSSISIDATINAYNNRAITHIKLQRYHDAVNDCSRAIQMDDRNIKALLRRGSALDRLKKSDQALTDYEKVLQLEPSNQIAIAALNRLRGPCASKKIRMKIEVGPTVCENTEEILSVEKAGDFCTMESKLKNEKPNQNENDRKSLKTSPRKLLISENGSKNGGSFVNKIANEIDSTSLSETRSNVCFCGNAPTSSQYLSPQPHFRDIYCQQAPRNPVEARKPQSVFTNTQISCPKSPRLMSQRVSNEPSEGPVKRLDSEKHEIKSAKCYDTVSNTKGNGDNSTLAKKRGDIDEHLRKAEMKSEKSPDKARLSTPTKIEVFLNHGGGRPGSGNSSKKGSRVIIEEISSESCAKLNAGIYFERSRNGSTLETQTEPELSGSLDSGTLAKSSKSTIEERDTDGNHSMKQNTDRSVYKRCPENSKVPDVVKKALRPDAETRSEEPSRLIVAETGNRQEREVADKTGLNGTKSTITTEDAVQISHLVTAGKHGSIEESGMFVKQPLTKGCTLDDEQMGKELEKIESPYEFLRRWHSLKYDPHLVLHANLLKALSPENINTVIANELDGGMLSIILLCFEQHFCSPENSKLMLRFLQSLGKVKRFSIVKLFMDEKDKEALRKIFLYLNAQGSPELIRDLRNEYDIPV